MPLSLMIKPASSLCNLRCEYCFYSAVASERAEPEKGFMNMQTAEKLICSALKNSPDTISFVFQGGEPLLAGINFCKQFVSLVNNHNRENTKISYSIQTNGTLIDKHWCGLFKQHGFLVGVSLDGSEQTNSYRKYSDGKNAFSDITAAVSLLKEYEIPFNISSVLTKQTAGSFRSDFRFFRQHGYNNLQYIPCLLSDDTNTEKFALCSEEYQSFLNAAFGFYYNGILREQHISIRQFDNYRLLLSGKPAEQCGMNVICSGQAVVEADGSVYPCDFYCADEWRLGNINNSPLSELLHSEKAKLFIKESIKAQEECRKCRFYILCRGGGCKRIRKSYNFCSAYKSFFEQNSHKLSILKQL